jgi:hypothetical protein
MRSYRILWTERHQAEVEAESLEAARDIARALPSRDTRDDYEDWNGYPIDEHGKMMDGEEGDDL